MSNVNNKNISLEILISTKDRDNLDFLNNIFVNNNTHSNPILIINQTQNLNFSCPHSDNINLINVNEIGLSKSRNLAIENAKADICLLADDDIVYENNFESIILNAFNLNPSADIITFKMNDFKGNSFKDYPIIKKHNKKSLSFVNSVVIAFRRNSIISNKVFFDENFGLGSTFQTADEYVFLRDALNLNLDIVFHNEVILSHPVDSSGKDVASDRILFAKGALFYKYYNILSFLKLIHYLYLMLKFKYISLGQVINKYLIGVKGIIKYIKVNNEKK
jgi:glycosyltransferase involved in cell wall biosynthesis